MKILMKNLKAPMVIVLTGLVCSTALALPWQPTSPEKLAAINSQLAQQRQIESTCKAKYCPTVLCNSTSKTKDQYNKCFRDGVKAVFNPPAPPRHCTRLGCLRP